jgi:hypothetical protein
MLNEEYEQRGIAKEVKALASRMQRSFGEYQTLRRERLERETLAPLEKEAERAEQKRS